jgi:pyrroline-5-carboxylate reductase
MPILPASAARAANPGCELRQFQPVNSRRVDGLRQTSGETMDEHIAFIGGGNMASAIIGGLLKKGMAPQQISVVEPFAEARDKLLSQFGITAQAQAGPALERASLVVWAVKPQTFKDAALATRAHTAGALHLSVAAGIRSDSIARWLGTERVVRAMPNTPALVGLGMTALFGRAAVTAADRQAVERVIATTGHYLWLQAEEQLDAVTAISGSGPAYVFYFLEAMTSAGTEMGLSREQAHQLALQTFIRAGPRVRRPTRSAAPARDLQGRNDPCRHQRHGPEPAQDPVCAGTARGPAPGQGTGRRIWRGLNGLAETPSETVRVRFARGFPKAQTVNHCNQGLFHEKTPHLPPQRRPDRHAFGCDFHPRQRPAASPA